MSFFLDQGLRFLQQKQFQLPSFRQFVRYFLQFAICLFLLLVAAKVNKEVTWVVGTGAVLPVVDASIHLCTSLFSPIPEQEILRVLKDHGYLMVVTPATEHLYAMREALFEEVNPHEPGKFVEQLSSHFDLVQEHVIDAPMLLQQQDLKHLIAMTPYAYKAKPELRQALEQKQQFELNAQFQIYLFQKKA